MFKTYIYIIGNHRYNLNNKIKRNSNKIFDT